MISNKSYFGKMEENINLVGFLGDGKIQKVEGKSLITSKTKNGLQKIIIDMFYVPGIYSTKFPSIGQLFDKGYKVIFNVRKCAIIDRKNGQLMIAKIVNSCNQNYPK